MLARKISLLLILFFSLAPWVIIVVVTLAGDGDFITSAIFDAGLLLSSAISDTELARSVVTATDFFIAYWFLITVAIAGVTPVVAAIYVLFDTSTSLRRRLLWAASFLFLPLPAVEIYCCLRLYPLIAHPGGPVPPEQATRAAA